MYIQEVGTHVQFKWQIAETVTICKLTLLIVVHAICSARGVLFLVFAYSSLLLSFFLFSFGQKIDVLFCLLIKLPNWKKQIPPNGLIFRHSNSMLLNNTVVNCIECAQARIQDFTQGDARF